MKEVFKIVEAIFAGQNDNLLIFDAESGHPVFWTKMFEELLDHPPEKIPSLIIPNDILPEEESRLVKARMDEALEGHLVRQELNVITKSGESIPFEFSGSRMRIKGSDHALIFAIGRDISLTKDKERSLRESREFLQLVLENSPEYVFWKDENLVYQGANTKFAKFAGLKSNQEIVGKTDYDLSWSREQCELWRSIDKKVIESGVPMMKMEGQLWNKGKKICMEISKVPIRNSLGEIVGVLGYYDDISEHKLISDSLEIIATEFSHLTGKKLFDRVGLYLTQRLDADYVHIGEIRPDSKEIDVLGGAEGKRRLERYSYSMIGAPCENVVGKKICCYPEGVADLFPEDKGLKEMGVEGYVGVPLFSTEGTPLGLIVVLNKSKIEDEDLKIKVLNIFIDRLSAEIQKYRTQNVLLESERKYRQLIEQSNDAIYVLKGNRFVLTNKAFKDMFGYSDEELAKEDFHFLNVVAPSSRDRIVKRADMLEAGEKPSHLIEFTAMNKEGVEIECQANISYVDYQGQIAAQGIVRDISERKRSEALLKKQKEDFQELSIKYSLRNDELRESIERIKSINTELEEAKEKAEESDRLKSAFLANMSHEIRTPMNGILGFANILKSFDLDRDKQEQYLNIIEDSGNRMLNLINDLIDISKIEAGLIELCHDNFNVNNLIDNIEEFFRPLAGRKGLQLYTHKNLPDEEVMIISDENKIHQVLTNLVNNAIKFTESGSVSLSYIKKGHFLEFSVSDTGIGVNSEMVNKIFERFRQGEMSFNKDYEGSGLGLAISRELVSMMGGEIWLESELGKGSTFYFSLPLQKSETETEFNAIVMEDEPGADFDFEEVNILVAEDDDVSFELIKEILVNFPVHIFRASNGMEAIRMVEELRNLDLIFMDMKMPVLDGVQATRKIKEMHPELPVVIQSAFVQEDEKKLAREAGCDDYISKPIRQKDLIMQIRKLVLK